jgi:hypothetical protein
MNKKYLFLIIQNEEWFNYLESMLENFLGSEDSRIPSEFKTDEWWITRNL